MNRSVSVIGSPTRSHDDPEIRERTRLRSVAESLLAGGQAPPTRGWELGTDALAMLYRLASDQKSSDDALAVLHEIQVYQVELDLQLQQLETNEDELTKELQRYRDRYEQAPVGYLLLSNDGRVIEANQAAMQLFASAVGNSELGEEELRIDRLLKPGDRPVLITLLNELRGDQPIASCEVDAIDAPLGAPALRITARLEPGSDNVWMVVS
ncbi:MAG: PAS domain-containing protein [Gammaproteobacteria bacterium]|nr:MAG: PAS domain-containing protein [Gammaproteobacteria bacterium]